MLLWTLIALHLSATLIAQRSAGNAGPADVITLGLGAGDVVTFRQSQRVITRIDLRVGDAEYSVPLECAGGLREVRFDTVELPRRSREPEHTTGTFALMFDMGDERERRYGALPRVQISFYRGRITEMLVTRRTGPSSGFSAQLCESPPVGPVTCRHTRQLQGLAPDVLVQQLRELPTPLPSRGRAALSDAETQRRSIYEELLDRGAESVPALLEGLRDPDVRLRRNVVLAFGVLSGGWWQFECGPAKVDIRPALPALIAAFLDSDADVRAWAAQAVGNMGAGAADAVGPLTSLLTSGDAGARFSACMALGQIGRAAGAALPALRAALSDRVLHGCAVRSIQRIEP